MSHKILRLFIVKVSVIGYFTLHGNTVYLQLDLFCKIFTIHCLVGTVYCIQYSVHCEV